MTSIKGVYTSEMMTHEISTHHPLVKATINATKALLATPGKSRKTHDVMARFICGEQKPAFLVFSRKPPAEAKRYLKELCLRNSTECNKYDSDATPIMSCLQTDVDSDATQVLSFSDSDTDVDSRATQVLSFETESDDEVPFEVLFPVETSRWLSNKKRPRPDSEITS
jgi:hypothetical protein